MSSRIKQLTKERSSMNRSRATELREQAKLKNRGGKSEETKKLDNGSKCPEKAP